MFHSLLPSYVSTGANGCRSFAPVLTDFMKGYDVMQRMKQWIVGCAALVAVMAAGCATSSSPVEETTEDTVTACPSGQSCLPATQVQALRQSCYPAAGLCGVCPQGTAYDCLPLVPNPMKGNSSDWDCYCCSGTTCM